MRKMTVLLALVGLCMVATSSFATVVHNKWSGSGVLTFGNYADGNNLAVIDITPFSSVFFKFNIATIGIYPDLGDNPFYSDPAKNADQYDQSVSYGSKSGNVILPDSQVQNGFIVGIKDTIGGGDNYHNNMALKIESAAPVPEAGTMVLLGAGLLSLAIFSRRRMNKKEMSTI
jgi:hypothetical protein